ncbi:hypothetical protein BS47DRAFT_1378819 [Hydnum rufescens UP504]|uniref:Metallo-beta-lactamase domain-containing protein n=1 Tax=Hydnum rufescens UP504 TaxID=1448309 RepID=A0A9P6BD90_9AGAM|nr:hypothetical protein BS47DRAFT_1378819 [Hydnum rufescens UP504]
MISLSFLGSSAGVAPLLSRACTAGLLHIGGQLSLIDCAEGTQRQFLSLRHRIRQRNESNLLATPSGIRRIPLPLPALSSLKSIFITHMHLDHCMGLPVFLTYLLCNTRASSGPLEIFGPPGIRLFIRSILHQTSTNMWTDAKYRVNELLTSSDDVTPCEEDDMHSSELIGRDLFCGTDGLWRQLHATSAFDVSAGPIVHRVPCLGYVFTSHIPSTTQANDSGYSPVPKKIVYLGDTSDPSAIAPLAQGASLLVHEATFLDDVLPRPTGKLKSKSKPSSKAPQNVKPVTDGGKSEGVGDEDILPATPAEPVLPHPSKQTTDGDVPLYHDAIHSPNSGSDKSPPPPDSMRNKAVTMGHSTASMAGAFARRIDARALALTHFSSRYRPWNNFVAKEFERHAMLAWNSEDEDFRGVENVLGRGVVASSNSSGSPGEGFQPQERQVKAVSDFSYVELPEDGPGRWTQL